MAIILNNSSPKSVLFGFGGGARTAERVKNPNRLWLARAVGGLKGECTFIISTHFKGT
jgi:hypothetical protein